MPIIYCKKVKVKGQNYLQTPFPKKKKKEEERKKERKRKEKKKKHFLD